MIIREEKTPVFTLVGKRIVPIRTRPSRERDKGLRIQITRNGESDEEERERKRGRFVGLLG